MQRFQLKCQPHGHQRRLTPTARTRLHNRDYLTPARLSGHRTSASFSAMLARAAARSLVAVSIARPLSIISPCNWCMECVRASTRASMPLLSRRSLSSSCLDAASSRIVASRSSLLLSSSPSRLSFSSCAATPHRGTPGQHAHVAEPQRTLDRPPVTHASSGV